LNEAAAIILLVSSPTLFGRRRARRRAHVTVEHVPHGDAGTSRMFHGGSWQIFALEHPGNRSSGNPETQLIRRQSVIGSWMFQHCRLSLLFEHCQDEGVQMPDLLTDAGLSVKGCADARLPIPGSKTPANWWWHQCSAVSDCFVLAYQSNAALPHDEPTIPCAQLAVIHVCNADLFRTR